MPRALGPEPEGSDDERTRRERLEEQLRLLQQRLDQVAARTERLTSWLIRAAKVLIPFGIFGGMLAVVYVFYPEMWPEAVGRLASTLLLGKLSAVGGQEDFLFWLIVLGTEDAVVGLFLVWNFDLVYRVPGIGPWFARTEQASARFLKAHGWVRRGAFFGIMFVVIVPFQGTGSVMGSFLGRLIGMGPWRAFLAIAIGAYVGVALVLSGSAAVVGIADVSPVLAFSLLAVLALAGFVVWRRFFRTKKPQ